ncbi:hypothetical protein H3N56_03665 [Cetobacterium sp. 2A]|uniref:hypothetical protein n=1 Tax=unclassified Cetobacterium TaxID=2630983 RepID=UPI00163D0466|nr:hypothetical protein [Cetobacterium sp. 2A]MBC2855594.1 hypothetical protein [Cetobacterium sp. 2A]
MKKIVILLSLCLSLTAFASKMEKQLEKELESKYGALNDGKVTLHIHEYDVDLEHNKIKVELEIKGKDGLKTFDEMDKAKFDEVAGNIAKYVKDQTKKTLPVEVIVKVDEDFVEHKYPYNKTF